MSWRDRLQPASFRGVPFHVEGASGQGGRRVAVHEYPLREEHGTEDLGRSAGSMRLQALVIGADYDQARNALIEALDAAGPGALIHPHLGTLQIQVQSYDWRISTRAGGRCSFDIQYVLAGGTRYPRTSPGRGAALERACDAALIPVYDGFEQGFKVDGAPAWVGQAAIDQLTTATADLKKISNRISGTASQVRQVNGQLQAARQPIADIGAAIDDLGGQLSSLVLQPRGLATQTGSVIAATLGGFTDIKQGFEGYKALSASFGLVDPVPTRTPSRQRQADNQAATVQLLRATAVVELSRQIAIAPAPFTRLDEAIAVRDTLLAELDALAETADDASYQVLTTLATALIARIDAVAPGLGEVRRLTLQQTQPALVLAHRLYGDGTRAEQLAAMNGFAHPGFIDAGRAIEYLQAQEASDA